MNITEFLLARIAGDRMAGPRHAAWCAVVGGDGRCDCDGAARVLADCEAKRRIVERAIEAKRAAAAWTHRRLRTDTRSPLPEWARWDAYAEVLQDLAAAHADHPDYDEAWRD